MSVSMAMNNTGLSQTKIVSSTQVRGQRELTEGALSSSAELSVSSRLDSIFPFAFIRFLKTISRKKESSDD